MSETNVPVQMNAARFREVATAIEEQVSRVMVAQDDLIRHVLIGVLSGGHTLIEGVPGLGKTRLVKTLASVLDLGFHRIQFTPDLMPADITGTNVLVEDERGNRRFTFQRGPVFANVILADEINRATPKTQSALLEAMQDRTVTIAGTEHALADPFFVLATQNPLEMEGTYPLPEAQLDRFLFKLVVEYPTADDLTEILRRTTTAVEPSVNVVANAETINAMSAIAREVPIAKHIVDFIVQLTLASHPANEFAPQEVRDYVQVGVSPRGAQAIVLGSKIRALLENRLNVSVEDVLDIARPALGHRLVLNFNATADRVTADQIIDRLLSGVPQSALV
jgi:MoxR-like ATPase